MIMQLERGQQVVTTREWKVCDFTIHQHDNANGKRVVGLCLDGLGVHNFCDDAWVISHLATGLKITCLIGNMSRAIDVANEILPLADWTIEDRGAFSDEAKEAVRPIHMREQAAFEEFE